VHGTGVAPVTAPARGLTTSAMRAPLVSIWTGRGFRPGCAAGSAERPWSVPHRCRSAGEAPRQWWQPTVAVSSEVAMSVSHSPEHQGSGRPASQGEPRMGVPQDPRRDGRPGSQRRGVDRRGDLNAGLAGTACFGCGGSVVTDWPGRPAAGHAAAPGPGGGGIETNLPQPDDTRPRQTNLFPPQAGRCGNRCAAAGFRTSS
jgi:hypothetical protein